MLGCEGGRNQPTRECLGQVGEEIGHFLDTVYIFRTHIDVARQNHLIYLEENNFNKIQKTTDNRY